jgi:hypothetical protein
MEQAITEIRDMIDIVKDLLIANPRLRDHDKELIVAVWKREVGEEVGMLDFFSMFMDGKRISLPETITRARRKVQQAHEELRGELWEKRQARAFYVQTNISKTC